MVSAGHATEAASVPISELSTMVAHLDLAAFLRQQLSTDGDVFPGEPDALWRAGPATGDTKHGAHRPGSRRLTSLHAFLEHCSVPDSSPAGTTGACELLGTGALRPLRATPLPALGAVAGPPTAATLERAPADGEQGMCLKSCVPAISEGGVYTEGLGCELAGEIAGIAPVAGPMTDQLEPNCKPSRPLPVLLVHGTADPIVPYAGGTVDGQTAKSAGLTLGSAKVDGAAATMNFWRQIDGCSGATTETPLASGNSSNGTSTTIISGAACKDGTKVSLYRVNGGGGGDRGQDHRRLQRKPGDLGLLQVPSCVTGWQLTAVDGAMPRHGLVDLVDLIDLIDLVPQGAGGGGRYSLPSPVAGPSGPRPQVDVLVVIVTTLGAKLSTMVAHSSTGVA